MKIFNIPYYKLFCNKLKVFLACVVVMFVPCRGYAQFNAEQVLRVGQNALYFEDYMLSIQYFNRAISAKPYLAQPYFFRAIAKLNLDDYLGAEEDATAAIERNPFIADAYEVRGVARHNRGNIADAVADYDSALKLVTKSRGLMFNKAMALKELNLPDSAMATLNVLLEQYPSFENAYIGRARLYLERGDTLAATKDIDHALELDKNLPNGYLLRADIAIHSAHDYKSAASDLSEAIRLQPREAGLYINRAFLRYNLDDYEGAMSDYDYALQLDPLSVPAMFNRGLLRMEVRDNDNAIKDFSRALELDPEDYRSLYNRAYLYLERHDIENAMIDVNRLLEGFPDLPEAYYMRSNLYRMSGKMTLAEKDYNKALELAKNLPSVDSSSPLVAGASTHDNGSDISQKESGSDSADTNNDQTQQQLTPDAVARRFTALRTVETPIEVEEEYNNKSIRGRVQDRMQRIELEPLFTLSYYTSPTELHPSAYYMKEIDDVNSTRMLRFMVQLTNDDITLNDDDKIKKHFTSVDYYNSYLSNHTPRAIDYFGRAMDFVMLCDYTAAVEDLTRALELTPDFALGYFERGVARYRALQSGNIQTGAPQAEIRAILSDFDKAIEYSPRMAFAYFNKGNIFAELGDYTSALREYNKAIELKPDFGEVYYNRGYVYFELGNREKGMENLSKAGELGVIPSYNLIKRMH